MPKKAGVLEREGESGVAADQPAGPVGLEPSALETLPVAIPCSERPATEAGRRTSPSRPAWTSSTTSQAPGAAGVPEHRQDVVAGDGPPGRVVGVGEEDHPRPWRRRGRPVGRQAPAVLLGPRHADDVGATACPGTSGPGQPGFSPPYERFTLTGRCSGDAASWGSGWTRARSAGPRAGGARCGGSRPPRSGRGVPSPGAGILSRSQGRGCRPWSWPRSAGAPEPPVGPQAAATASRRPQSSRCPVARSKRCTAATGAPTRTSSGTPSPAGQTQVRGCPSARPWTRRVAPSSST